ncbi:MAG: hypothetical protein J6C33_03530 [Lachnospiraceae bacterium]|nr:hypothetical protein [Lachnospiraceae bacterium]
MKRTKGCYGYLQRQKKKEVVKTIAYFALSLAIFAMGYFSTGTKTNLLTIVAVLGCLPASKSAVSMFMYLKAGVCSDDCYREVEKYEESDDTLILYDLYLTSYLKNFQISAMAVKNNALCGYTEDAKCDLAAGEKHIADMLRQNGYDGLTVKLFRDRAKFIERLGQMNGQPERMPEKEQTLAQLIKDISL